ncbi:MAG: cyclase family protein, partial [Actinomycetota bacterium]
RVRVADLQDRCAGPHELVSRQLVDGSGTTDEVAADEFVWPIYKIDVRGRTFEDNFVQKRDIRAYEREHGRIPKGALVVLQTGAEEFWGADELVVDDMGNANNVDDLFDFVNPGFSSEAVQWLFDRRHIDGVGSDAYGPDAATDDGFGATFTALDNDGVALVALANLDRVAATGDIVMAPTVSLSEGSGFATDPIACHGRQRRR